MLHKIVRATALGVVLATAANAAEYDFVVTNKTDSDVRSIWVKNGEIAGFKRVPANGERAMAIVLPDGVCDTVVQVSFADNDSVMSQSYNACDSGGLDLGY